MTAKSATVLGPRTELLVPCVARPSHHWLRVDEDRNENRMRAREDTHTLKWWPILREPST